MISYDPLWRTLKLKGVSTYKLRKDYNFSKGTLDRLKQGKNITMETLNCLCEILECDICDVIEYKREKK
ncbi:helix-turn-helix transcriptional regulator [Clostridium sp. WB02_MRS01]|uniref:helix-turn-helix domain-containing protein n=1 Tax=Clostridium sp. WB02_MRS01 TaxID=2605777 RepID=UPI0012B2482F|nr:helix-turn-helix transcriptional regulator [Clostridium sp. WB02_MRS01]MSS08861.1 helix-turn-helix transcriptional regulator [Clostridium sp. WB02_MRS01]